jgi:hypothetical protein
MFVLNFWEEMGPPGYNACKCFSYEKRSGKSDLMGFEGEVPRSKGGQRGTTLFFKNRHLKASFNLCDFWQKLYNY